MDEEERRGRRPWANTEPMWSKRESQWQREKNARYRMPEQWKQKQADEIKRRFANYLDKPKKAKSKSWPAYLALTLTLWWLWKLLHSRGML